MTSTISLTPREQCVLNIIKRCVDTDPTCPINVEELSVLCQCHKNTVLTTVQRLERKGFIQRQISYHGTVYTIIRDPSVDDNIDQVINQIFHFRYVNANL